MKWLRAIIGHWRANRYRTKQADDAFRTYDQNLSVLENGGTLWVH